MHAHPPSLALGARSGRPVRVHACPPLRRENARRGPGLRGPYLRIRTAFSQIARTRRLPTRQSVHVVKALRSTPQLAIARGTTKPDSKKRDVVHFEVKKSAATGDVEHERRLRLSDRDLQVLDLKAAGALSSFAVTCATFLTSATTMAAHSIMVCALSQRRLLASAQTCSPDLSSS